MRWTLHATHARTNHRCVLPRAQILYIILPDMLCNAPMFKRILAFKKGITTPQVQSLAGCCSALVVPRLLSQFPTFHTERSHRAHTPHATSLLCPYTAP